MATVNPNFEPLRTTVGTMVQAHWKSFLIEGISATDSGIGLRLLCHR